MGPWNNLSTGLCNQIWGNTGMVQRAQAQRIVFDKLMHPGHPSIAVEDNHCSFCGQASTLDHIIRHCPQPELKHHRQQIINTAEKSISQLHQPAQQLCNELLSMATSGNSSHLRIWSGLWNQEITDEISDRWQYISNKYSASDIIRARPSLIIFMRILAVGLQHLWSTWSAFILPTNPIMTKIHKRTEKQTRLLQQQLSVFSSAFDLQLAQMKTKRQRSHDKKIRATNPTEPETPQSRATKSTEISKIKKVDLIANRKQMKQISEYFVKNAQGPSISCNPRAGVG